MHEVLVNRLGGLSIPRKSVVRLTDRPDMTLDVYRGRKTTMQKQQLYNFNISKTASFITQWTPYSLLILLSECRIYVLNTEARNNGDFYKHGCRPVWQTRPFSSSSGEPCGTLKLVTP